MPEELAELSDDALMHLFSRLTAWADHLNVKFAIAEVDEETAEAWLKQVKDMALITADPQKGEVKKTQAAQALSEEVQDATQARLQAYAYRKLVAGLYAAAERRQFLVSRELTRRGNREPQDRRERRWTP